MDLKPDYRAIENEVLGMNVRLDAFLSKAKITRRTWDRWKAGSYMPTTRNLVNVEAALDKLRKKKASEAA